jgi:hypothetical protein
MAYFSDDDFKEQILKQQFSRVMVVNSTFNYISVIMAISFIGGGNRSAQRKPPICQKSPSNFIT